MKKENRSSARSKERRTLSDPIRLARTFRESRDDSIRSDVNGSYTGITREGDDPIQDVDDL